MSEKLTYVATLVVLNVVESIPDLPAYSNDGAAVSLRHELVGGVVVVEVVLETLQKSSQVARLTMSEMKDSRGPDWIMMPLSLTSMTTPSSTSPLNGFMTSALKKTR